MKAVVFDRIGPPLEVLEVRDIPRPAVAPGQALVRMLGAPISPGDFLFIANLYPEPKRPAFPQQVGGNHGMGIVEEVGAGVALKPGARVVFSYYNTWAEYAAVPAEWLIPVPDDYPVELGAQFFNLITAWDLVEAARVPAGGWLAITAGYSTVSVMALQFAKARGLKVVSLVRRLHGDLALESLGADAVFDLSQVDEDALSGALRKASDGRGLDGVIDSVGGPATGEIIRSCAFGARVIINGGMSEERFALHNFDVLLSGLEIRAYVYRYFFDPPQPADADVLDDIVKASSRAGFYAPVGGFHPLEELDVAIGQSLENPGAGKRLFRP